MSRNTSIDINASYTFQAHARFILARNGCTATEPVNLFAEHLVIVDNYRRSNAISLSAKTRATRCAIISFKNANYNPEQPDLYDDY